jgi:nucleotide-binding universal stress UspA family protein
MQKILIATDFSPAARNATDYALQLAAAFQAEVVLMSAFEEAPIMVADAMVVVNTPVQKGLVQRQLEEEVDNLMTDKPKAIDILAWEGSASRAIGSFTPLDAGTIDNNIAKALENVVETSPIGILILRPEPKSLIGAWLYGSTTRDMVFESSVPLLILPATPHD